MSFAWLINGILIGAFFAAIIGYARGYRRGVADAVSEQGKKP